MTMIKTIAVLCQLSGAGSDSISLIEYVEKQQLQCQQYYIKCLGNPLEYNYKTISKCISKRKL